MTLSRDVAFIRRRINALARDAGHRFPRWFVEMPGVESHFCRDCSDEATVWFRWETETLSSGDCRRFYIDALYPSPRCVPS